MTTEGSINAAPIFRVGSPFGWTAVGDPQEGLAFQLTPTDQAKAEHSDLLWWTTQRGFSVLIAAIGCYRARSVVPSVTAKTF